MAETTTATLLPFFSVSTTRLATRLIDSVSATDEPPYFCTMRATAVLCSSLRGSLLDILRKRNDYKGCRVHPATPRRHVDTGMAYVVQQIFKFSPVVL